ncbi:MAG: hypothetical protein M5U28_13685 [Sandaracinaceae bacterium]|nr:hypothetical protein [Sandaracinaceae bacterium]
MLARAARFIGVFRVTVTPAATLEVDGGPPLLSRDGRVLLAIGEHELSARAEGHSEERLQVRVHGGEEEELRLTLTPLARGSGEQAAAAATEGSARRSSSSSPRDDTAAHVLLTSGAAAAAGAVALGLASWMTREEQLAICESPPAGYVCDNPSALRTERDVAAALTVGLAALGAGALVVGGVLLSSGRASEPSLSCAPSGLGLACAGRF